jgi:hypothetical protein
MLEQGRLVEAGAKVQDAFRFDHLERLLAISEIRCIRELKEINIRWRDRFKEC